MQMTRDSILKRLQGLAAKSVASGCTEDEALSAADMLGRLMDRYGFDKADLGKIEKEKIDQHTLTECGDNIGSLKFVVPAVATYCDVKVWMSGKVVQLFGRDTDVMIAKHLLVSFQYTMMLEWFKYRRSQPGKTPNSAKTSFELGMMQRISARLKDMKSDRNSFVDQETGMTGTSLVVQKTQVVAEAFKALDLKLKSGRSRGRRVDSNSYAAGRAAGDRVGIRTAIGAR